MLITAPLCKVYRKGHPHRNVRLLWSSLPAKGALVLSGPSCDAYVKRV